MRSFGKEGIRTA